MKKMKGFRKVLALVLALMMVFSAAAALADDDDPGDGDGDLGGGDTPPVAEECPVEEETYEEADDGPALFHRFREYAIGSGLDPDSADSSVVLEARPGCDAVAVGILYEDDATVTKGDVTAVGVDEHNSMAAGISVEAADGTGSARIMQGNVYATGAQNNFGIFIDENSDNKATVMVGGNVTSDSNGSGIYTQGNGTNDILIEGTLSGDTAVVLNGGNNTLTAWKIESTKNEKIVVGGNAEAETDFAASINYIVKLGDEQILAGMTNANISTGKGKTVTADWEGKKVVYGDDSGNYDYHTANAGETVSLTLTDEQLADYNPEKNELEVLYNTDDATSKMALGTSAGNGVFTFLNKVITLVMQSGGGMKLGFSFKAKTPEVQPEENQPEVKPEEKPEEKPEVKPEDKPEEKPEVKPEDKPEELPVVPAKEETEAKPEDKPKEEKVESKQEAGTEASGQAVAAQTADNAVYTEISDYNTPLAGPKTVLTIRDKSGKAELAFRNVGKYEIKSPDGNDEGSFGMEDGKIVLTSQTGKKMNIGQDGKLEYVIGNQTYEFKFGEADLEKLAAVKK